MITEKKSFLSASGIKLLLENPYKFKVGIYFYQIIALLLI